jgi:Holliday junction resolvase
MEAKIQAKIIKFLRSIGVYVIKTIASGKAGIPDVICCYNGSFVAFEVKAENGRVSDLQEYNINQIKSSGGSAFVVRSVDEVKQIISAI